MQRQSSYKVHWNTISNGELSDPLSNSVNRGLTLVRLRERQSQIEREERKRETEGSYTARLKSYHM